MLASSHRPPRHAFLTVISMMILVGAEVFSVAIAGAWALAGLFELGDVVGYALMVLFSLAGLYIMVGLWRRAHAIELSGRH